jgi:hypothetical protein
VSPPLPVEGGVSSGSKETLETLRECLAKLESVRNHLSILRAVADAGGPDPSQAIDSLSWMVGELVIVLAGLARGLGPSGWLNLPSRGDLRALVREALELEAASPTSALDRPPANELEVRLEREVARAFGDFSGAPRPEDNPEVFDFGIEELFKVVNTDNFGGDYPNESFFIDLGMPKSVAQAVAQRLNEGLGHGDPSMDGGIEPGRIFKIVPMGYELQPGFEP